MIAVLVADGFDEAQYLAARRALEDEGAVVHVVSPDMGSVGRVIGWNQNGEGVRVAVDVPSVSAVAREYDALLIPGGDQSVEALLLDNASMQFAGQFLTAAQPIGCIGEGVAAPIRLGSPGGRRLAAPSTYRQPPDTTPGGTAVTLLDEPVVLDGHLLTSRGTADLGAFLPVFLDLVAQSPTRSRPMGVLVEQSMISGQTGHANVPNTPVV